MKIGGHDPEMLDRLGAVLLRQAAAMRALDRGEDVDDAVARALELVDPSEAGEAAMESVGASINTLTTAMAQILREKPERPEEVQAVAASRLAAALSRRPLEMLAAMMDGVERLLVARLESAGSA